MNPATVIRVRLVLLLVGFLVWAYGAKIGDRQVMWVGIGVLAVAFLLRFFAPRTGRYPRDDDSPPPG